MQTRWSIAVFRVLMLCASLGVAACHITLLSDYDAVFDQEVTGAQKDVDALFQKIMANPDAVQPEMSAETYAANKDSYAKIQTELDAILVRAQAHQHNQGTIDSVNRIMHSFSLVEEDHKNRPSIRIEAARGELRMMNQDFTALMREELLKKQAGTEGK